MPSAYDALVARLHRLDALRQTLYHLEWDQHTYMPPGGTPARSQEMSMLSAISHEILTSPETGRLLAEAEKEETDDVRRAQLREARWSYDRDTKVPARLVEALARESSEAFEDWVHARAKSDFARFRPRLARLVELKREYAERIDASKPAYEVLFNDYEPYIPLADARRGLDALREGLRPLLQKGLARKQPPPGAFKGAWPAERQMALAKRVVALLGYDFAHGRIDVSPHPFSSGNAYDARITTRFEDDSPLQGVLAAIHEAGHAMYMQGLPKEHFGTPLGDARDLVVHESQSRLWENQVGRSLPFWQQVMPILEDEFPGRMKGVRVEDAWREANHVEASHIRVYADELTYHMHIALRFEIEERLISGALRVDDVPATWNDLMETHLGIRPRNDAEGCLQDMHWSGGSFGYFPTYSLGSMLAAQLHAAYQRQTRAAPTDHASLKRWLHDNVHRHGRRYETLDLVKRATGRTLAPDDWLAYAKDKYEKVWASA